MKNKYIKQLNLLIEKHRLHFLRYVVLFMVILFGFHFFYNAFLKPLALNEDYNHVWVFLQRLLYSHSVWVLKNVLNYDFISDGFVIIFPGYGSILVDESCSAAKWLLHFAVLMLIFPGPWKHKAWFIPTGLVLVHFISVTRIVGLTIVFVNIPERWDIFHDYVFRPFFYGMLFLVWVAWVEYFFLPARERARKALS